MRKAGCQGEHSEGGGILVAPEEYAQTQPLKILDPSKEVEN